MNSLMKLLSVVAVVAFVSMAYAADEPKDAAKPLAGKITKIDGAKITVTSGKATEAKDTVVATDDKTTVTLDDKAAKVADLKEGMHVKVTLGTTATAAAVAIVAKTPAEKGAGDKATK